MDALRPLAGAVLVAMASPSLAESMLPWRPHIVEASRRFGIPEPWIMQVMRAESGGRTHLNGLPIRSHAGAMGLMQLMPATWASMRDRHRLGGDPDDPRDNILAGTAYLRAMYDRFGYPGLFGAYNAGPARYARYRSTGAALPSETRLYMAKIGGALPNPVAPILPDGVVRAVYEPAPPTLSAIGEVGLIRPVVQVPSVGSGTGIFAVRKVAP